MYSVLLNSSKLVGSFVAINKQLFNAARLPFARALPWAARLPCESAPLSRPYVSVIRPHLPLLIPNPVAPNLANSARSFNFNFGNFGSTTSYPSLPPNAGAMPHQLDPDLSELYELFSIDTETNMTLAFEELSRVAKNIFSVVDHAVFAGTSPDSVDRVIHDMFHIENSNPAYLYLFGYNQTSAIKNLSNEDQTAKLEAGNVLMVRFGIYNQEHNVFGEFGRPIEVQGKAEGDLTQQKRMISVLKTAHVAALKAIPQYGRRTTTLRSTDIQEWQKNIYLPSFLMDAELEDAQVAEHVYYTTFPSPDTVKRHFSKDVINEGGVENYKTLTTIAPTGRGRRPVTVVSTLQVALALPETIEGVRKFADSSIEIQFIDTVYLEAENE